MFWYSVDWEDGFKRLWFCVTANLSTAGIPLAYINNFIQIWCGAPFCSMLCGSNSCRMYLEPHRLPFESTGKKYIWIVLLRLNTNDSRNGFHRVDCNLRQCPALACHMIWIFIRSVLDGGLQRAVAVNCNRLKPAWDYLLLLSFDLDFFHYTYQLTLKIFKILKTVAVFAPTVLSFTVSVIHSFHILDTFFFQPLQIMILKWNLDFFYAYFSYFGLIIVVKKLVTDKDFLRNNIMQIFLSMLHTELWRFPGAIFLY